MALVNEASSPNLEACSVEVDLSEGYVEEVPRTVVAFLASTTVEEVPRTVVAFLASTTIKPGEALHVDIRREVQPGARLAGL